MDSINNDQNGITYVFCLASHGIYMDWFHTRNRGVLDKAVDWWQVILLTEIS